MGTRADFYVGKGVDAEWIGSVAWDGNEWGERIESSDPDAITGASTEEEYRAAVGALLKERSDGTTPDTGWPWPWGDSKTTDCSYCFVDGKVEPFSWGEPWNSEGDAPDWPDFSDRDHSAKAGSDRSGLIMVGV